MLDLNKTVKIPNKQLHTILVNLNITPDLLGYKDILHACSIEENGVQLYKAIAKHFNTTQYAAERNIRSCVLRIDYNNPIYKRLFGINKRVTVNVFVATLRESIKLGIIDDIYSELAKGVVNE